MAPVLATYRTDGAAAGIDQVFRLVGGDGYRPVLDRAAPGAFDDAVAHAAQFFAVEWPAVARWNCGADDVAPIGQPVLNVTGGDSSIRFTESPTSSRAGCLTPCATPSTAPTTS